MFRSLTCGKLLPPPGLGCLMVTGGMYTLALVGRAVAEWTDGAEVVDLGAKFTSPVVVPAEGGADVVVAGTVKSVADGLVTLALEVTCGGQKVLGMPKAVVKPSGG